LLIELVKLLKSKLALKSESREAVSLLFFGLIALCFSGSAYSITKCQDSEGKWHYGDHVRHLCMQSNVTKMNSRGIVRQVIQARKLNSLTDIDNTTKEQQELDLQRKRLLNSYRSEKDIERKRKSRIAGLEKRKQQFDNYLSYLQRKKAHLDIRRKTSSNQYKKDKIDEELKAVNNEISSSTKAMSDVDLNMSALNSYYEKEIVLYRKCKAEQELELNK